MGAKWATKAFLEVIQPRICVTLRRTSSQFRPKKSKIGMPDRQAGNATNTMSGSHDGCFEKHEYYENQSNMDPYWMSRSENQAF